MSTKRIIILGSGCNGVKCAETLREELALDQAEVVHFSCEDAARFQPAAGRSRLLHSEPTGFQSNDGRDASRMPLQDASRCRKKPERALRRLSARTAVEDIRFSRTVMSVYRLSRGVPLAYEDKAFQDERSWSR